MSRRFLSRRVTPGPSPAWHRLGLLALALAVFVAACGGSSESDANSDDSPTPTAAAPSDTSDGGSGEDTSGDDGYSDSGGIVDQAEGILDDMTDGDGGMATVTIGDQTWEFSFYDSVPIATCDADFFGGFLAVLTSGDDIMVPFDQIMITLPGGNFTDPPEIEMVLKVDETAKWIADETIYEQHSNFPPGIGVTSFTIDGQTASGTATFYEENSGFAFSAGQSDEPRMADGTFLVKCSVS